MTDTHTLPAHQKTPPATAGMSVNGWSVMPTTFAEMNQFCHILAQSDMVPKNFKGKAGDIFVAIQLGSKFGWDPLFSLQSIASINGNPAVWGKGLRALVMNHPDFAGIDEEELKGNTPKDMGYRCTLTHKKYGNRAVTFTLEDAAKANLLGRDTYKNYPMVMCMHRAFSRCAAVLFPDATSGMVIREIAEEEEEAKKRRMLDVSPTKPTESPTKAEEAPKGGVDSLLNTIETEDEEVDDQTQQDVTHPRYEQKELGQ